jgi:hypothetical protein
LSADTIVPSPGNPQSLNRYAYTLNNPVKYTDPTGHYVFEEDPSDPWIYSDSKVRSKQYYTHPEYKQGEITDAQFVAAATSPIWVPAVALVGAEEAGELWFIAHGGIKGLIALLTGAACGDGDCTNEIAAGVTGIRRSIAEKILQNVTTSVNETLEENPGLARTVLSRDEYARGQTQQWAAAQYGNAVERLVAGQVRASPLLTRLYQHVSRPGASTPDFVGKGVFSGLNFDVTVNTARQIANHLGRWYGPGLVIATYNRPPGFTVFP